MKSSFRIHKTERAFKYMNPGAECNQKNVGVLRAWELPLGAQEFFVLANVVRAAEDEWNALVKVRRLKV